MPVEVMLLGVAQDAGVPQAGCYCYNCAQARRDPAAQQFACCLALLDRTQQAVWLIDATPDFREQLDLLKTHAPECQLRGILITHAHMGHYTGLVHLGREALNASSLPVYGTASFGSFLKANAPWSQLIALGNIAWRPIENDDAIALTPDLTITPVAVPHRGEFTDTVAYVVRGPRRTVFYCPDIDAWAQWERDAREFLRPIDLALIDGTFFADGELTGRDMRQIPHPRVRESVERFQGLPTEINFVHLNHTNPLWQAGPERSGVESRGFQIGRQGQCHPL